MRRRWLGFTLVAVMAFGAMAGGAAAHTSDDHGEVTFHDSEAGPSSDDLQCEFWVQGQNMTHEEGEIRVHHDEARHQHSHFVAEFNGTENGNGTFDFELGPLEFHSHFTSGNDMRWIIDLPGNHSTPHQEIHYQQCEDFQHPFPGDDPHSCTGPQPVEAHHDGDDIVVTWNHTRDPEFSTYYSVYRTLVEDRDFREIDRVDANETSYRDENVTAGEEYAYTVTARHDQTGREDHPCDHAIITAQGDESPACPENLQATAHGNEDISLSWNASADADTYHVYRATGDGPFEHVANVTETNYTDADTEAETTYTYEVTAANEAGEADDCDQVEVTAIPFFGSPAIVAVAALASVGAFAALRVRSG